MSVSALPKVKWANEEFRHEYTAEATSPGSPSFQPPSQCCGGCPPSNSQSNRGLWAQRWPETGPAREPRRRVQSSRMSCQTWLHQTRWEGTPSAGSTEQTMLLRGVWQTNVGQNLYILMKKQRPLRQGVLRREQTDSEVRELYSMFKLRSTDHNCSSYFLQFPHPVCHFSSMLWMKAGIVQTARTTHISLNHSISKMLL